MALVGGGHPAFAGISKLALRGLPVVTKRQAAGATAGAGAGTAFPTAPGAEVPTSAVVTDPALAGSGINSDAASSYLAANGIPPAILSDPAVQSAISSVASQQGIPVSQISDSLSSLNSGASTGTSAETDTESTATDTAGTTKPTDSETSSSTDSDSSTTTSTTKTKAGAGAHSTPTGVGSTDHSVPDDGEDFGTSASATGHNGAGFKLSVKAGWLVIATIAAAFFAVEGV